MRTFLLIVFVLSFNFLFAQNEIKISGTVAEDSTLLAVPFVTVSFKQTATLTDINGKFSFTISATNSDSIIFSCIGYENKIVLSRNFLPGEQTILLTHKVYELPGPNISGLTSRGIIKKAVSRIPEIFVTDTFYTSAFYRQYHEENTRFVRLIEALITVENRVEKNSVLKSSERVAINHIRRSDVDERNNEEHGDHLMELLEENPVYHALGTMLNPKALDLYRFYFDTTRIYPDSIYHIFYYSTDRTRDRFDRGEIFISSNSFAILKLIKEEFKNPNPVREVSHISPRYCWDFLSSKLVAEYKIKNGKMQLESLMKTYTHDLYDAKVFTKEFVVTESFELTVQDEAKSGPLMQKYFSDYSNLYNRKYFYNAAFWKDYSNPDFYFRKGEEVKYDLEKNKKLEEQFLQNGTELSNR